MATETSREPQEAASRTVLSTAARWFSASITWLNSGLQFLIRTSAPIVEFLRPGFNVWHNTWLMRFMRHSLLRRIIASNLVGLCIVLFGLTYLTHFSTSLIDAKLEHLQTQGQIVAAAIASKATVTGTTVAGTNDPQSIELLQDDPFAAIEFSIKPERITPLLPSLLQGTRNRARVYDTRGNLIADTARIGILVDGSAGKRTRTKNFWTRLTQWLLGSELKVYREIGEAQGTLIPEVRDALSGRIASLLLLTKSGDQVASVAVPVVRGEEVRGVVLLSAEPGAIENAQSQERFAVFMVVIIAMAAAMVGSYLLARTVAEPMGDLSLAAQAITRDIQATNNLPRFAERVDEVGQLARSFRTMTSALYKRIQASEKFAADVAHELKNPLAAARSTAESLSYAKTDTQRDEIVEQIQLELKRLNRLISDVSNASRLDAELALQRFETIDLRELTQSLVSTFDSIHSEEGLRILLEVQNSGEAFLISGQEGRIGQVLTNLISNAVSFTPAGGDVRVLLHRRGDEIHLLVEDSGPGIPPESFEKIFERFYTFRPTKDSSRGDNSGLGLAISREIVEAHGGSIWADNREKESGARFTVRLPVANGDVTSNGRRLRGGRQ